MELDKSIKLSTEIDNEGSTIHARVFIFFGLFLFSFDNLNKELCIFLFNNLLWKDLKIISLNIWQIYIFQN